MNFFIFFQTPKIERRKFVRGSLVNEAFCSFFAKSEIDKRQNMRKVILDLAVTLDGFIEGPNGEVDWCIMDEEMDFAGFMSRLDTIFYGRISYDGWGNYQPAADAEPAEKELWQDIHAKRKYVFSHQAKDDANATYITTAIQEKVAAIKQEEGKDIWLYGGASLIRTFIELDLVDVYQLSVHPTVLGAGKPLFENLKERLTLTLKDTKVYKSGVVQLIYERQG